MSIFSQIKPIIASVGNPRSLLLAATACFLGNVAAAEQTMPLDAAGSFFHFTGDSFLHSFHGEAKEISGSAVVNTATAVPVQSARLVFKTTELTTSNKDRDTKMKEWMHVDIHPEVEFALEKVRLLSGDCKKASSQDPARFEVSGELTLNGVKQRIAGEALGWREKNRLVVTGDIVLNTLKFGLPQIRMTVITVAPDVKTSYRFSFNLPAELALK